MRVVTSLYLIILTYIIAALVFWEMRLQQQSGRIYAQEVITLRSQLDSLQYPVEYSAEMQQLSDKLQSRTTQYVAEGATFLVVILIGAAVVYGSFIRRIGLSRQQSNFMLAVTHELKSPLASIKLNLQTLEKHKLDEAKRDILIARCISESNRLNELCNNMLFTSQIEGGQYKPALEPFSLSVMVEDVVSEFGERYQRRFEEDIDEGLRIMGDRSMLRMAVTNLVENAIKYTPENGLIKICLELKHNVAFLRVIDEGPGIPDSEKKKVFDKFYRVGNEESRKAKGTGLGLYLGRRIVEQHKGKLIIKDNKPTGAIFELQLPVI